jgi:hypothetical protein
MIECLRLVEMDNRSAPPEIGSLINNLHFPELKQFYYAGAFKPDFQRFLVRHPRTRTLFIGTDISSGAHELLAAHKLSSSRLLLPNLTALQTTVPILHTLFPLLDPSTPLIHITISFGYHGCLAYLNSQISHLLAQNAAFTNQTTGKLEGLIFPSVRILRLDKLVDEVYSDALQCFLPRFPNLTDIGHVVLSVASSRRLIPILPQTLAQIHLVYEGIMWDSEFDRVKARLKEQCKDLTKVDLWAWSEAYYDFWSCRWGPGDAVKVINTKEYVNSVPRNPAILWVSETTVVLHLKS